MRITRIDFEGQTSENYATAKRRNGSNYVEVTILTPAMPNGRDFSVQADSEDDLFSMADCLQHELDGCRGTNSMIHDYYRELCRLSDV